MNTQFATIDGLKIRYAISTGSFTEHVLLISPLPESILAFTPIWKELAESYNLIAIDLPGLGKSESRMDLFSFITITDFVIKVMDYFRIEAFHIIGPDIGAPIALYTAAKCENRVKSVILNGGACVFPLQVDNVLKQIIEAPNLDDFKAFSVADIINNSLSELSNYKLPDEIREDYISSYKDGRLFQAMEILRAYKKDVPLLDSLIHKIKSPVQIIWGEHDPIAPVSNAYALHERLSLSKLDILKDGGHYIWEERASEYTNTIQRWIKSEYLITKK